MILKLKVIKKFLSLLTEECRGEVENSDIYKQCNSNAMDMSNYEEICKSFNSKQCEDYYKDPLSFVPKCTNDEFFNLSISSFKGKDVTKNYYCLVVDDNKVCPVAEASLNGEAVSEKLLEETCKSKACIEGLIKMFEDSIESAEEYTKLLQMTKEGTFYDAGATKKVLGQYVEFLKSEECTSQAKDDLATAKYIGAEEEEKSEESGANTIKSSGILMTTLGFLLYYLL